MRARLDYRKAAPGALRAMGDLERYVGQCGLEPTLVELVKVRASQINGCAFCLDMHTIDARALGETEQRLYTVSAWEETPFFTDRERAALRWTEHVTLIASEGVPDAVYEEARQHFSEQELVNLTLAIATINAWNRLAISFRSEPGHYVSRKGK